MIASGAYRKLVGNRRPSYASTETSEKGRPVRRAESGRVLPLPAVRALEILVPLSALLAVWAWASAELSNPVVLPDPMSVALAWAELLQEELPTDIAVSLRHLGIGCGAGILCGGALAVLSARLQYVGAIVDPLIEMLRPIGAIAWIPLAILIFGIGSMVPIFLVFYASVFPTFLNTYAGIRQTSPNLIHAAQSLGASPRMVTTRVIVPSALPMFITGARLSIGTGWMSMVAAELVGGDSGLGWRVFWYQEFFRMDKVMAVVLTIGALGYGIDLLMRRIQRQTTRWSPEAFV